MADLDRKELDRMATILTEVENPDIYSKDETHINKPISNIKFGHILNINWDNILNTFRIIQKFFKETVLNQDVATDNTANKIVKRNADKSIEVGDIYCSSEISSKVTTVPQGAGIPFKHPDTGKVEFTKDYEAFRKMTNTISKDDMNAVEKLDIDGSFDLWYASKTINLKEEAKNYKVLAVMAAPKAGAVFPVLLIRGIPSVIRDENRDKGGTFSFKWDGGTTIAVSHTYWRHEVLGQVRGVWGVL